MSNLIRWEPFRDMITLREAMDHLFDEAFTRPLGTTSLTGPAVDMYQTETELVVKAALPGLKSDDVQISITGDVLTLRGEMRQKEEVKNATYHIREQRWGAFERSVLLPTEVESDKAKADFADGVLTISLPKAERARPKTITVKAK